MKLFKPPTIKVVQWNILADGLSGNCEDLGGFTHSSFSSEIIKWEYRKPLIIKHLKDLNPDIICLQEADCWVNDLEKEFSDYDYIFNPKENSKCGNKPDGCVLIWKKNVLTLISKKLIEQSIIAELFHIKSNSKILCATTHLKHTKTWEGETIRLNQLTKLLNEISSTNSSTNNVILCLDANTTPNYTSEMGQPLCYDKMIEEKYKSSYKELLFGKEPEYTTYKERGDIINRWTIDYIIYKCSDWIPIECLYFEDPYKDFVPIPNADFPSDHIYLCSTFMFFEEPFEEPFCEEHFE